MAHYIDKDALIAEIEKIIPSEPFPRTSETLYGAEKYGKRAMCFKILDFINTLEVKEVDLEKEIQNVIHNHFFDLNGIAIAGTSSYATVDDMVYIARHFFELGLKVNNEKEK